MTKRKWSEITPLWEAARARGENTFMPPHPCARGHQSPRRVSNGVCIECSAEHSKRASIKAEKRIGLASNETNTLQINQDEETASLESAARKQFTDIVGRPVSRSVLHKAAIRTLALYLRNANSIAEVCSLIR